jgi:multidrug efflux system membrane fusion protein
MKSKTNIHLELGKLAAALVLTVAATGCEQPTKVAAKSPTPVHLADVAVYSSSEGLRYSASVLPFAEATLSFKSAGYVTGVKQVVGAYGRRRNIGAGDYVSRGADLAQIRHQD